MTPDIRSSALRAAAKLALSTAVFGSAACAGSAGPSAADDSTDQTSAETAANTDLSADHTKTCTAKPTKKEHAACCNALIDRDFPSPPKFGTAAPPEVKACCDYLGYKKPHSGDEETEVASSVFGSNVYMTCCAIEGASAAITCTPWGPPVPPAMRSGRRLRNVARSIAGVA